MPAFLYFIMNADKLPFLIYGAYGYTGELITRFAISRGHRPLLGGRDENKLKSLAQELNLPYLVFNLTEEEKLDKALRRVSAVIHCAGPFSKTAKLMVFACLRNKVNYLDITGEIEILEWIASKDAEAKKAGIILIPGTGFDVVPSDCLAAYLKSKLPDASHLELAFAGAQKVSRGTALTMIEKANKGGMIRENGILRKVPTAFKTRKIPFTEKEQLSVSIPWGDIATAYYSTGIPNIIVYTAVNATSLTLLKASRYMGWLLENASVQNFLKNRVYQTVTGPNLYQREHTLSHLWGQVINPAGQIFTARLHTAEAYHLTAQTAVLAVEQVEARKMLPGFKTPSMAFGADFILQVKGTTREDVISDIT